MGVIRSAYQTSITYSKGTDHLQDKNLDERITPELKTKIICIKTVQGKYMMMTICSITYIFNITDAWNHL
jgi:hypothetical protein